MAELWRDKWLTVSRRGGDMTAPSGGFWLVRNVYAVRRRGPAVSLNILTSVLYFPSLVDRSPSLCLLQDCLSPFTCFDLH